MSLLIISILGVFTLWTTMRNLRSGIAHPIFQVIGLLEIERSSCSAFFWGMIAFNWLTAGAIAMLILNRL
jgi:hypothetical protein